METPTSLVESVRPDRLPTGHGQLGTEYGR